MTQAELDALAAQGPRDPMELQEGHFQQDDIERETNFMNQFTDPNENFVPPASKTGMEFNQNELTPPSTPPLLDAEGNPIVETPFKFDETLAEEEKVELAELNQKLGTNFPDLKSLQDAIKSKDIKEEDDVMKEDEQFINYFNKVLTYNDEATVLEDKKMIAQQAGKNLNDPEVIDEIQAEVEQLKHSGSLPYVARSIKDAIRGVVEKKTANINAIKQSRQQTIEQQQRKIKDDVQASINEIFKAKNFFGIVPTKEDLINVYSDVTKNKHIEHLRANPSEAVEYALFKKYKGEISKRLGKPDFKAGVKNTLQQLGMEGSSQTGIPGANTNEGSAGQKSFFEQFLQ